MLGRIQPRRPARGRRAMGRSSHLLRQDLRQRLLAWARTYRADEPVAGTFRARQLQAVLRLTPQMMTGNFLSAALLLAAFWPTPMPASALS